MARFLISRSLQLVGVVLAVTGIVFFALRLGPFDPSAIVSDAVLGDPEQLAELREYWGLDDPLLAQYGHYLADLARLDLGRSLQDNQPVTVAIGERLPATIELALASMVAGTILGIGLGLLSAFRHGTALDVGSRSVALMGISFPSFWLGVIGIAVFAVKLRWLPSGGRLASDIEFTPTTGLYILDGLIQMRMDVVKSAALHLALPAGVLGLGVAGLVTRITRAAMLTELGTDYMRTAIAKGNSPLSAAARHALPNALLPITTIVGLMFGLLLSGAVIVESVFTFPGMGKLLVDAISVRDFPQLQASILVLALTYSVVNALVDYLYVVVDPRVRLE